jgi:hypothetical protein
MRYFIISKNILRSMHKAGAHLSGMAERNGDVYRGPTNQKRKNMTM